MRFFSKLHKNASISNLCSLTFTNYGHSLISTYYYTRVYPKFLPDQVSHSIYGQNLISGGALERWVPVDFKTVLEHEFWTRFEVDMRLANSKFRKKNWGFQPIAKGLKVCDEYFYIPGYHRKCFQVVLASDGPLHLKSLPGSAQKMSKLTW